MNEFDIVEFSALCDRAICKYIDYMYDAENKNSLYSTYERLLGNLDTIFTLFNCMENKSLARYMEFYFTKKIKEANDAYIDALSIFKTRDSNSDENN